MRRAENKVARHSTALGERRYRCYLPVLAEFTRLPMHGTWPARTMRATLGSATAISLFLVPARAQDASLPPEFARRGWPLPQLVVRRVCGAQPENVPRAVPRAACAFSRDHRAAPSSARPTRRHTSAR